MPLTKAQCTNCGGLLEVDQSKDAAICPFCKTPYIVEKAINNYQISITTNNGTIDQDTMFENWLVSNDEKLRKDYAYYYATDAKRVQFMDSIDRIKTLDYHQPLFGGKIVYVDSGSDYSNWDDSDRPTALYDKPDSLRDFIRLINDQIAYVDNNFNGARFEKYHDRYKARLTDAIKKLETRLENALKIEDKWKQNELQEKDKAQSQEKHKAAHVTRNLIILGVSIVAYVIVSILIGRSSKDGMLFGFFAALIIGLVIFGIVMLITYLIKHRNR